MRGKDQTQFLLLAVAVQFRIHELIQRQIEQTCGRYLNAQATGLRISGVTFGCFGVHAFGLIENGGGIVLTGKKYWRRVDLTAEDGYAAGPKADYS